jgi:integrase
MASPRPYQLPARGRQFALPHRKSYLTPAPPSALPAARIQRRVVPSTKLAKENGEPYDPHWVYMTFVASVHRLGFEPVPLHMLLHIAASLLIAVGVDIAIVSERLGHPKST